MDNSRATKLKISFVTNKETNKAIEELIYKSIAKAIFESEEFQKNLIQNKDAS
ncbi:MAG: hypothetical protein N2511_08410 [Thermodesulfovibrionales bacterium]|nr:hypothetical protein [Thermodesulfovibrionales bacterium]